MPVIRKIQSINLYIAWSFKDFLNIHVWNVYIFENKLYRSFLALYNEYNVKIISTLYNWMPKISKIFSIFTSEMFILLKKALSSSFPALYNEYIVYKIISAPEWMPIMHNINLYIAYSRLKYLYLKTILHCVAPCCIVTPSLIYGSTAW
jgi:hypothetical protein